jgi:hypothetical protein
LLRDFLDPSSIVHFFEWSSVEDARRFFESPRLVQIHRDASVKTPKFHSLMALEPGVL